MSYDVTLILYSNTHVFYKEIFELPVKLIIHNHQNYGLLSRTLSNAIFLRRTLSVNYFDVIHTMLFHNGFWVRVIAPLKYNNRIVYSIRNDLQDSPWIYLFFEKFLIHRSYVVTNSLKALEQMKELVSEKHGMRLTNIYNGFDVRRFTSTKPAPVFERIILGTVGRQTTQKNQIQILEAIKSLKVHHNFHFYLIGDKNENKAAENELYVKQNNLVDCVTIMDSQHNVEHYYKRFNIFILASLYEGCPNVLFEAMLSRCLCVVSKGANTDNFIKDGETGLLYDGTTTMLEEKISQAVSMVMKCEHLDIVNRGYKYAADNFSLNKMIDSYERIYSQIDGQ